MLSQARRFHAFLLALLALAHAASGADVFWLNAVSGNWTDPSRWSGGAVPVAGDNVYFTAAGGSYTVNINEFPGTQVLGNVTCVNSTGMTTLRLCERTLRSAGTITVGTGGRIESICHSFVSLSGPMAKLKIDGGAIGGTGNLFINGAELEYLSGTLGDSTSAELRLGDSTPVMVYGNTITNTAFLGFTAGSTVEQTFINQGRLDVGNATFNGNVQNMVGGTLTVVFDMTCTNGLINHGSIMLGGGAAFETLTVTGGELQNFGLINTPLNANITAAIGNELTGTIDGGPGTLNIAILSPVIYINRGTIKGGFNINLAGGSMFRMVSGLLEPRHTFGGPGTIRNGPFEYLGGSIMPPADQLNNALVFNNCTLGGSPFNNTGNLTLLDGTIVNFDLTNEGTVGIGDAVGTAAVNGAFLNRPGALLTLHVGNTGGTISFNGSFVNEQGASVSCGTNGINDLTVAVPNAPLINRGRIHTVASNGRTTTINAQTMNESTGVIETVGNAHMRIEKAGAHHSNAGLLRANGGVLTLRIGGGSRLNNLEGGTIRADGSRVDVTTDAAPHTGSWVRNAGVIETTSPGSVVSVTNGAGRVFQTDPTGIVRAPTGLVSITNLDRCDSNGQWEVGPGGRFEVLGNRPDNYDSVAQRWSRGGLRIDSGEYCMPANTNFVKLDASAHCLGENLVCGTPGATPNPLAGVNRIEPNGEFTFERMNPTVSPNFTIDGSLRLIDAVMTTTGTTTINGEVTIDNNGSIHTDNVALSGGLLDLAPDGMVVTPNVELTSDAQATGEGMVQGSVTNTAGIVSPGSSPGRLEISQNYTQRIGGRLIIEIGGTTPGTQHDVLAVGQTAALAGSIEIRLINGFVPSPGAEFSIVVAGARSGAFDSVMAPPNLFVMYSGAVVKAFRPCSADWNHSGVTSVQDIFDFLADYFSIGADFNGSGATSVQDIFDFLTAYFSVCA